MALFEKKRARGENTPLDLYPELDDSLMMVFKMFVDLHNCRPQGFGVSAIPPSDIASHLDLMGYFDDEFRAWAYRMIRALDDHTIKYHRDKTEVGKKNG